MPKSAESRDAPTGGTPAVALVWPMEAWGAGSPLDLAPMVIQPAPPGVGTPNSSDGRMGLLPLGVSPPTPKQGTTPQDGLSTSRRLQPRRARIPGQQGRAGGGAQDGEVARRPLLKSRGTKDRNREAGRSAAALPTAASHTGFTGLPQRRGEAWPEAIHYKLVQGGQGWRSHLHTPHPSLRWKSSAPVRTGPRASTGLGTASPFVRWVKPSGSRPLWASLFPIWQPSCWTRSALAVLLILIMSLLVAQLYLALGDPVDYSPPGPLSVGFSRQEYWSGLPCPPPGHLPDPGIKLTSLTSPALAGRFFTTGATWEA